MSSNPEKPVKSFSIDDLLNRPHPQNSKFHPLTASSEQSIDETCLGGRADCGPFFEECRRTESEASSPDEDTSSNDVFLSAEDRPCSLAADHPEQVAATPLALDMSDNSAAEYPKFKLKRARTAFSVPQIQTLEFEFDKNQYLTAAKRKELSRKLKLSETQIKIWFQNRRTKLKRKNISDMESWIQQLYSPLGPMAPRPLVVGDQLYLFRNPSSSGPRVTNMTGLRWPPDFSWQN